MAKSPHTCTVCGKTGAWGPAWAWYGSIKELENGSQVPKFCSAGCARQGGFEVPELTPAQAEAYRERAQEIINDQDADFEMDPGAAVADSEEGAFVACWVWVGKDEVKP